MSFLQLVKHDQPALSGREGFEVIEVTFKEIDVILAEDARLGPLGFDINHRREDLYAVPRRDIQYFMDEAQHLPAVRHQFPLTRFGRPGQRRIGQGVSGLAARSSPAEPRY